MVRANTHTTTQFSGRAANIVQRSPGWRRWAVFFFVIIYVAVLCEPIPFWRTLGVRTAAPVALASIACGFRDKRHLGAYTVTYAMSHTRMHTHTHIAYANARVHFSYNRLSCMCECVCMYDGVSQPGRRYYAPVASAPPSRLGPLDGPRSTRRRRLPARPKWLRVRLTYACACVSLLQVFRRANQRLRCAWNNN